jgi:hypothetical protein
MRRFLRLLFLHGHATLGAVVRTFALGLLVLNNAHSLHSLATIDARYGDIGADCLMLLNFFANTLCLAISIRIALYRCKFAKVVMGRHLLVLKDLSAAHGVISAFELHLLEFLLHFLLDAQELGFNTLHGTHTCLIMKLF